MTDEFACHIGLPKAGSTFLQHNIFPVLFPEVPSHPFEDYGWQTDTNYAMALLFDDNTPDPDGPLFSHEWMSAAQQNPHASWDHFLSFFNRALKMKRKPRILFIIREHEIWIKSQYIDRIKKTWPTSDFETYANMYSVNDISWSKRIKLLQEHFPTLVLSQEGMLRSPLQSVRMIAKFWKRPITQELERNALNPPRRVNNNPRTKNVMLTALKEAEKSLTIRDQLVDLENSRDQLSPNLYDSLMLPKHWFGFIKEDWTEALSYSQN